MWVPPAIDPPVSGTYSLGHSVLLRSGGGRGLEDRHAEKRSGLPGTGIGSITTVGFTSCLLPPLGPRFTLRARDLPWHLNVLSYNDATGVVTGSLSHLQIRFSSFVSCTAVIDGTSGTASDGTVKFSYSDRTGVLQVRATGGNLHFYNVQGCAGLTNTGDSASISATFTVSPKQAITNP
jgi:hypothetical protein